jgi:UDP:flavonoid glycosyltransferase YjiC (YdhE family)
VPEVDALESHLLVTPYVPFALLCPEIDLRVSQGGAGGVFGALSHGQPQLLLPQGGDQFVNTEACVRAGGALALLPGRSRRARSLQWLGTC